MGRGRAHCGRGWSLDQWLQICITLIRSRIRIRIHIKVKSRIRILIRIKVKRRILDTDPQHFRLHILQQCFESATLLAAHNTALAAVAAAIPLDIWQLTG